MTYVYDIFVNFNNDFFEFYEWNKKDVITHIKKMPVIKINSNSLKSIINGKSYLNKNIICKYQNKGETYNNNLKYNYLALTNGMQAIVIFFNSKGNIIKKSSLIFEDEESIIEVSNKLICNNIIEKTINLNLDFKLTRNEKEKKEFLIKNIKKISDNKLKYLYFDCFNKKNNNLEIILKEITCELKNNNEDIWQKCYNLINLVYQKNK